MPRQPQPIAVVTGASRGIGRAVAVRLARDGYRVWALARSRPDLDTLAREAKVEPLVVDVSKPGDIARACTTLRAGGRAPLLLVNNAGIAFSAPLLKTPIKEFEKLWAVNVRAPFLFCQELVPGMVAAGQGTVLNIASSAALRGFVYASAYTATKHALLGLTRSLALELARKGVTVNAVCPGWTDTDMVVNAAQAAAGKTGKSPQEIKDAYTKMNPTQALIRPEDVAGVCSFLASKAARSITGAAYTVDGGATA